MNEGQETAVVLFRTIFSTWTELLLCQLCMERYEEISMHARCEHFHIENVI